MDKEQVIGIVKSYKEAIAGIVGDCAVYLYGSYSRGTATTDSDIDVAVVVPTLGEDSLALSARLWSATRTTSTLIEPILLSPDAPSPLFFEVVNNGILIA